MKATDFIYEDSLSFTISDVDYPDYRPDGCKNVSLNLQVKAFVSEEMILQLLRAVLSKEE